MEENRPATTLIRGNIQRSDDVKNRPSNKGHQMERGGSVCERANDLLPSENQAKKRFSRKSVLSLGERQKLGYFAEVL